MAVSIDEAQQTALACVCAALEAQDRPVCKCYATLGEPLAANCCECETDVTGEAAIRFERMYDADPQTFEPVNRIRPCRGGVVVAEFVITVYRCFPTITETGEVPDPEDQSAAAAEMNQDVSIIWHALACCSDLTLSITEIVADADPSGGCSELNARLVVEVSPGAGLVVSP